MRQEVSAGGIVFRRGPEGPEFLLLQYGAGHWDFPKGHVEAGETEVEAAQREIHEETGIPPSSQEFIIGFKDRVQYSYRRGAQVVQKHVHFFVVLAPSGQEVTLSHEHKDHAWLRFEEARERLTFRNARNLLTKGYRFLRATGLFPEEHLPPPEPSRKRAPPRRKPH